MASTSIFNNNYQVADTWDMQGAVLIFTGKASGVAGRTGSQSDVGATSSSSSALNKALIVRSLTLRFGRTISKIYPINISRAIQLLGIPSGSLEMSIIWGPSTAFQTFLIAYRDSCGNGSEGSSITIRPFGSVCQSSGGNSSYNVWKGTGSLKVMSPVIEQVGLQVQAAEGNAMPVYGSVSMSFMDLQLEDGDGGGGSTEPTDDEIAANSELAAQMFGD